MCLIAFLCYFTKKYLSYFPSWHTILIILLLTRDLTASRKGKESWSKVRQDILFKLLRFYYLVAAPLISYLNSSFSNSKPLGTLSKFHPDSLSLLWEMIFVYNLLSMIVFLFWSDWCAHLLLEINLILDDNIQQGRKRKRGKIKKEWVNMRDHNDFLKSLRVFKWDDTSFVCQSLLFGNRYLLHLNRYYVH